MGAAESGTMKRPQQKEANKFRERRGNGPSENPRSGEVGLPARAQRPLQPLSQVPSQLIFLSLTGGSFAGTGLFPARDMGGVQRSVYHPLAQAV